MRDRRIDELLRTRQRLAGGGGPPHAAAGPGAAPVGQPVKVHISLVAVQLARSLWKLPDLSGEVARCLTVIAEKEARGEPVDDLDRGDLVLFSALQECQAKVSAAFEAAKVVWAERKARAARELQEALPGAPGADADRLIESGAGGAQAVDSVGGAGALPEPAPPAPSSDTAPG